MLKSAIDTFFESIGSDLKDDDRDFLLKAFQGKGTWTVKDNNKQLKPVCTFQPMPDGDTTTTGGTAGAGGGTTTSSQRLALFPSHTTIEEILERVATAMSRNGGMGRLRIFQKFQDISHIVQGLISFSTIKRDAELQRLMWASPDLGAPRDFVFMPGQVSDDKKVPLTIFTKRKLKKRAGGGSKDFIFQAQQSKSGMQTMPPAGNSSFGIILPMLTPPFLMVMLMKECIVKGLGDSAGWR